METVLWRGDHLVLLDQTRLPHEETYLALRDYRAVAEAIRMLRVRGAPAIGVAAGYALALAALAAADLPLPDFQAAIDRAAAELIATRPTAVNLAWAVKRVRAAITAAGSPTEAVAAAIATARAIQEEDLSACRRIGRYGAALLPDTATVLTHCNAGALATAGYGTALGVIRAAVEAGKRVAVVADETRPLLQGARLTAWELQRDGIPVTLIADTMAGFLMQRGEIDCVVVGADRIAANGDTANKIGTYQVAVLAKEHGLPFYVAAPWSTVDLATPDGAAIPIEERAAEEVRGFGGVRTAPAGVPVRNPAFDVTPARYITAIVTDRGVARQPYAESLAAIGAAASAATVA